MNGAAGFLGFVLDMALALVPIVAGAKIHDHYGSRWAGWFGGIGIFLAGLAIVVPISNHLKRSQCRDAGAQYEACLNDNGENDREWF